MGKLVYYDGALAVCDFRVGEYSVEKYLKLLLSLDIEAPDTEKHIKPLLECWDASRRLNVSALSELERAEIREWADFEKLEKLGVSVEDGMISEPLRFTSESSVRVVLSIRQETDRCCRLADLLQYLAKLFFLSNGDERAESVLPEVRKSSIKSKSTGHTAHGLSFDAIVPSDLFSSLIGAGAPTYAGFDVTRAERLGESSRFTIPVFIPYENMLRYSGDSGPGSVPVDSFELKRLAATYTLASVLNVRALAPFSVEHETLTLQRTNASTLDSVLADYMIAGKIGACPHCGRPVLMPRQNSKPFCRHSHQTRYSEKARAMLNGGASVDEVAEAFPYIQPGTISGWLPIGGR